MAESLLSAHWEGVAFPRDFDHTGAVERASRRGFYDPWLHVAELDLDVRYEVMPFLGMTDFLEGTVTLHPKMTQAQERATLAHELVHVERGPFCTSVTEHEERIVEGVAAARLITFDAFLSAAKWAQSWSELADELNVDPDTARTRKRLLSRSERAIVRAAVRSAEGRL